MSATLKVPHEMHFLADAAERIGSALRAAFTGRGAAKRIAQAAEADPRTAEGWLYGRNAPRSPELIALMAANAELEKEIISMVHAMRENG